MLSLWHGSPQQIYANETQTGYQIYKQNETYKNFKHIGLLRWSSAAFAFNIKNGTLKAQMA